MTPLSQYLMIGKLIALLGAIGLICFQSSQIHHWHERYNIERAKLEAISSAKNEQKIVTREKIKVVLQNQADADERAKKVEQAPPAAECRTKPEVLQADL